LLKNIDVEKKGEIKSSIFFELAKLHKLHFNDRTKNALLREFKVGGDKIKYVEAT